MSSELTRMEWDISHIIVSLIFSAVGFVYFRYGKRQALPLTMVAGMVLMVYGYFVDSLVWTLVIGGALCALPFLWR